VSVEAEYEDFAQSRPLIVPDWLSATQYCEGGGLRGCPQCNYDKGAPMQRTLTYIVGFLGAAVAAVMLYVLVQEELGISSELIAAGSLASAGILSVALVALISAMK